MSSTPEKPPVGWLRRVPASATECGQAVDDGHRPMPQRELLVDLLEERLLTFEPLLKILEAVGVDPEGLNAKRLVSDMIAGLDHGIKRMEKESTDCSRWDWIDDWNLMISILLRRDGSEREAIRRLAAEYTFPSYKRQTGRRTAKSNHQTQYEEALWRRWMKIKRELKDKRGAWRPISIMNRYIASKPKAGEI
jgi:hypothetical protein